MAVSLYRGYSTVANQGLATSLYNIDLVVQDLLNQFNTRIGERRGRPAFGSIIHDLLFDVGDVRTESLIVADGQRIINEDPRVELLEIVPDVDLDKHEVRLDIKLRLVEFDMNTQFSITFGERV